MPCLIRLMHSYLKYIFYLTYFNLRSIKNYKNFMMICAKEQPRVISITSSATKVGGFLQCNYGNYQVNGN